MHMLEVDQRFSSKDFNRQPLWLRGSGLDWISGLDSRLTACGPSDGKEVKDVFGHPCTQGSLGTLKTPSCPWYWVPGSRSKFGN